MTVYEAWNQVMADVQGIGKNEKVTQGPARFNFRGIDSVMNAVGPALRARGVSVVPTAESIELERYQTAKGGLMQGAIVLMRYTVHGPDGDSFAGAAYGQAADSGDKAVSKAQSVAYRTFLLQALTVPTDEPDPDYEVHQRVEAAPPDPLLVAKNRLLAAVNGAGMEMEPFIGWCATQVGVDLRLCDAGQIDAITERVKAEGAVIRDQIAAEAVPSE